MTTGHMEMVSESINSSPFFCRVNSYYPGLGPLINRLFNSFLLEILTENPDRYVSYALNESTLDDRTHAVLFISNFLIFDAWLLCCAAQICCRSKREIKSHRNLGCRCCFTRSIALLPCSLSLPSSLYGSQQPFSQKPRYIDVMSIHIRARSKCTAMACCHQK